MQILDGKALSSKIKEEVGQEVVQLRNETGIVPGLAKPAALLGVAAQGYLTLKLTAHGSGGHPARPPRDTAIGKLAPIAQGGAHTKDPLHAASKLSDLNLERIRASRPVPRYRGRRSGFELQEICRR